MTVRNIHWPYYLALEADLETVSRYIEFDSRNFGVYSIELAHLLLASASEVDVVLKEVCRQRAPEAELKNIEDYRKVVAVSLPILLEASVVSRRYGLTLSPWSGWKEGSSPDWWRSYNKVKHERGLNFEKANLGNVLGAMAALLLVNIYYQYGLSQRTAGGFPLGIADIIRHLHPQSAILRLDDPFAYFQD